MAATRNGAAPSVDPAAVRGMQAIAAVEVDKGERERELEYRLSSVATEVAYAERQLRLFRDSGRALDALQRALEALKLG